MRNKRGDSLVVINIHKKMLIYLLSVFLTGTVMLLFFEVTPEGNIYSLKSAIVFQFIIFIYLFIKLGRINKTFITLYAVFLILFYVFQNGQLILYALDLEFDYFYVEKFPIIELRDSVRFSTLCMSAAFAAGVFSIKEKTGIIAKRVNKLSPHIMYKISKIGLVISGMVAYLLLIMKVWIWIDGKYRGVMNFEEKVPSLLGAVEALYPAFAILSIVSASKSHYKTRNISVFFCLWGLLTALIGDRTTGLGVIVVIALMYYKNVYTHPSKRNNNKFLFSILIVFVLFLISFIASFRNQATYSINSLFSGIVDIVEELGFSFFPLVTIMNMCPSRYSFLYGKSMLGSVVAGFIPESIDFLGIFSWFADAASIPMHWIAKRHQYGFGMDCSLNAECYANFGDWGFLAMFGVCSIVAIMLKNVDYTKADNIFSQYVGLALLFSWFTLPRRRSYYVYSKIFWYVIIVVLFIEVLRLFIRRKENRNR